MIELSAVQSSAQTFISGGSRISPRRGPQLRRGTPTYDFAKFSQKLHEIERIWAPEGGRSSRPPLDPPLFIHNAILFTDTAECSIQSVGTPYLSIIASNGPYFWADYKI